MTAIVMMVAKKKSDCTDMLMRGLAEPYHGPSTMVKEGGYLQISASFVVIM